MILRHPCPMTTTWSFKSCPCATRLSFRTTLTKHISIMACYSSRTPGPHRSNNKWPGSATNRSRRINTPTSDRRRAGAETLKSHPSSTITKGKSCTNCLLKLPSEEAKPLQISLEQGWRTLQMPLFFKTRRSSSSEACTITIATFKRIQSQRLYLTLQTCSLSVQTNKANRPIRCRQDHRLPTSQMLLVMPHFRLNPNPRC